MRFVDLTDYYWCGEDDEETEPCSPICAFLSTTNGKFVESEFGTHTFSHLEDITKIDSDPTARPGRLLRLLPDGFFDPLSEYSQARRKRNQRKGGTP